jgi:sugar lactone lactonase YvrE
MFFRKLDESRFLHSNPPMPRVLTILALALPSSASFAAGWSPLFDGSSLQGWIQRGGKADYQVRDGAITGTAVPNTPNSFLCTARDYGDFILELEFRIDPSLNAGIQFRSQSLPDYKKGQVHGYQMEIDPSRRGWAGGIYDEGRRGWIYPLTHRPEARLAFKQDAWNHYRVEAIGDSIRTWVNGIPAADLVDSLTLEGFIALQVHGVGKRADGPQTSWRNIRIEDLGRSVWKPLFNGKDLTGWKPSPGGSWNVADGILKGTSAASEPRHGLLLSEAEHADFTVRAVYRSLSGNSGLYFRAQPVDDAVAVKGFQAEIDSAGRDAGGLYETLGRGWVVQPEEETRKKAFKPGEWNEMTVSAHGPRLVVHLNGIKTADILDASGARKGRLGLQLHSGQDMDVEFKSIEILETPSPRPVPVIPAPASGPVVPEGATFRKLGDGYKFTEGPAQGPDGRIWFNDIPNNRTHVYDPKTGRIEVWRENTGGANGLLWVPGGDLYACEGINRQISRQTGDSIKPVAGAFKGKRLNSPNDLISDGQGGIYFTDPRYGNAGGERELERESVYYLGGGSSITLATAEVTKPNGVALSPDQKTLYVADTAEKQIFAWDIKKPGVLQNRRVFAPSSSDGMAVDVAGNLYLTVGPGLSVWSPAGERIAEIPCPENPANCAFGGPENKTLFVTARTGFYAIDLNIPGLRE